MICDLTPLMTDVLANIGGRSVTAHDLGVNGCVMKRLWELGFLKIEAEPFDRFPPYYSLSAKGEGAAAILTAQPILVDHEAPIARIKRIVSAHYKISALEMVSERRSRTVARPRQIAMYLARKLTPKSLPAIGRDFGNRDHTTVIHAVRKVELLMTQDDAFRHDVKTLCAAVVSETSPLSGDKSRNDIAAPVAEAA